MRPSPSPTLRRRGFYLGLALGLGLAARAAAQDILPVADLGWRLWPDRAAAWKDDALFLPADVDLKKLPINAPTGSYAMTMGLFDPRKPELGERVKAASTCPTRQGAVELPFRLDVRRNHPSPTPPGSAP